MGLYKKIKKYYYYLLHMFICGLAFATLSVTDVHLRTGVRDILRRLSSASEPSSALLPPPPHHHHLQVRRQPDASKDLLPHLPRQYNIYIYILFISVYRVNMQKNHFSKMLPCDNNNNNDKYKVIIIHRICICKIMMYVNKYVFFALSVIHNHYYCLIF